MGNLNQRIERIERREINSDARVNTLLLTLLGANEGKPVSLPIHGWSYTRDKEIKTVMRMEGESDEQLEKRAIDLAREGEPENKVIVLSQISREEK